MVSNFTSVTGDLSKATCGHDGTPVLQLKLASTASCLLLWLAELPNLQYGGWLQLLAYATNQEHLADYKLTAHYELRLPTSHG